MESFLNKIKKFSLWLYLVASLVGFTPVLGASLSYAGFNYGNILYFSGLVIPATIMITMFKKLNPLRVAFGLNSFSVAYLLCLLFQIGFEQTLKRLVFMSM